MYEQAWVPGRWFPNGYEPEPVDKDRLGDGVGMPEPDGDLDETDARSEGDGAGNGIPDPDSDEELDDMSAHLRADQEDLSLGSPPEEQPTHSVWDEAVQLNREIKRYMLQEYPAGAGMVDPTKPPKGFYSDFDADRDHGSVEKMQGAWYRSPARPAGTDGDPFRGDDPYTQLGFHSPKGPTDGTTPPAASGEEGVAARKTPAIWSLSAGSDTSSVLGAGAKPAGEEVGSEGEPEETPEEGEGPGDESGGETESEEQE